ncbi:ABC transporter substrate-binding protein [Clostridia bacterium]|nr:ABC transporter substrate-binding protein [Clostridia bacterium]
MKKIAEKRIALVLAFLLVISNLVACTNSSATNATAKEESTAQKEALGKNLDLRVSVGSEPQTMDPQLNRMADTSMILQTLFEGLMTFRDLGNGKSDIVPGQIKEYTLSEDGLTYTFFLRDDIFWHDGQAVTAKDFVYAWRRLVNPDTAAEYSHVLEMVKNAKKIITGETDPQELGIEATDEKTLVVTLEVPCAYFLEICAFGVTAPTRQDMFEQYGEQWTQKKESYIGNGPYKMQTWMHNEKIVVEKSDTFYEYEQLGPDSITFVLMDDYNAMLNAFNNNELDFVRNVPVDEIDRLKAEEKLKTVESLGTYYLSMNHTKAPFDDPRVREAFSLAIDRNFIVEQVTKTEQKPAGGFLPFGVFDENKKDFREEVGDFYSVKLEDNEENGEKARALLAEAGFPGGEGFPTVEYLYNTGDVHRKTAEALQEMWQTVLGIKVTLANQDWAIFLSTLQDGDFQIARDSWYADYHDPSTFLNLFVSTAGDGNNHPRYNNAQYDELMEKASLEVDTAKRWEYLQEAEKIGMGESFIIPLYYYTASYLFNDRLEGLSSTDLGYYFFTRVKNKLAN